MIRLQRHGIALGMTYYKGSHMLDPYSLVRDLAKKMETLSVFLIVGIIWKLIILSPTGTREKLFILRNVDYRDERHRKCRNRFKRRPDCVLV